MLLSLFYGWQLWQRLAFSSHVKRAVCPREPGAKSGGCEGSVMLPGHAGTPVETKSWQV